MANQARGEASIVVEGTTYTLRPTVNAICDLEDLLGQPFAAIGDRASTGELRAMRALIWAYLQDRHGDEIKTVKDAGKWIERAGGLQQIEATLQQVTALNAPAPAAPGAVDRPPGAQPVLVGATST
jgi:hypothetical protein